MKITKTHLKSSEINAIVNTQEQENQMERNIASHIVLTS